MNKQSILTAVLGLLVLGLTLDDMRLRARAGDLQEQLEARQAEQDEPSAPPRSKLGKQSKVRARAAGEGSPGLSPGATAGPAALSRGVDPDQLDARRAERQQQFQGQLEAYVDGFGADHELSEAVMAQVQVQVLATMEEVSELWCRTRTGEADRVEVRAQMDQLGTELELDLAEQLGATDAEAFMADLPGPLGENRPTRSGGR